MHELAPSNCIKILKIGIIILEKNIKNFHTFPHNNIKFEFIILYHFIYFLPISS